MIWKGYSSSIEYDDEDGTLIGRIAGIRSGISFHADTVEDLRSAFRGAVGDCIETCARVGKEPQKAH